MTKKTNLRLITAAILAVLTFSVSAFARLYDGGGTEAHPFIIDSAEKMNDIGNNQADWGSYFLLTADIDLSGYTGTTYNIIGYSGAPFGGVFDGNDHTISNFNYAYSGSNDDIGLFGYVDGINALIQNLTVADANVFIDSSDCEYMGSIVGRLHKGSVVNCQVSNVRVDAKKSDYVGGLAGKIDVDGKIDGCLVSGSITGQSVVGGLVGRSYGKINNCHTSITVTAGGYSGGLTAGAHNPVITNCTSAGSVFNTKALLTHDDYVDYGGGLIAEAYAPIDSVIENCHSSCEVTSDGIHDPDKSSALYGGLVGVNYGYVNIINCSASGKVSAELACPFF